MLDVTGREREKEIEDVPRKAAKEGR